MLERDIEFCINEHDLSPKGGKSYMKFDFLVNNYIRAWYN